MFVYVHTYTYICVYTLLYSLICIFTFFLNDLNKKHSQKCNFKNTYVLCSTQKMYAFR